MSSSLGSAFAWSTPLTSAWKWAVPDFYDKRPYDASNVWVLAAPMPLIALQIHLLIRYKPASTWLFRASLIPFVCLLALRTAYAFYYRVDGEGQLDGRGQHVNITLGCGAICMVVWSLGWGLAWRRPQLKVAKGETNGSEKSIDKDANSSPMPIFFPGTYVPLELDLLLNIRGVGWEHGVKDGAPALPVRDYTSRERRAWILSCLAPLPFYFLLYDAIFVLIEDTRFNMHARTRYGGSLWDCSQGLFGAASPWLICIAYASSFVCVQYMLHAVFACIAIGLFGDRPSRWDPPAVRWPWVSTSVGEFWSKRWHQYLRFTFMTAGYWPVRNALRPIAGRKVANIAAIFGAFLASGIVHDLGRVALSPVPGFAITEVTLFFAVQPVAIFGEQIWEYYTGRKVRGFWGWLWTVTFVLSTSPLLLQVSAFCWLDTYPDCDANADILVFVL